MSDERRREEQNDLATLMGSEPGRRALRRILDRAGVLRSVAHRDIGVDAQYSVWYASGQQDLGHWLLDELSQASWEGVELMNKEAHSRRIREEATRRITKKEKIDEADAQP